MPLKDDFLRRKIAEVSSSTYVILMKDSEGKLTLLANPGLNEPWHNKNKKLADFHAKNCNGEARTWGEAFELLKKEYPHIEKDLEERALQNHLHKKYDLNGQSN